MSLKFLWFQCSWPNKLTTRTTNLKFLLLTRFVTLLLLCRYTIYLVDINHDGLWETRGSLSYYTDLVCELLVLVIDLLHYIHMVVSSYYVYIWCSCRRVQHTQCLHKWADNFSQCMVACCNWCKLWILFIHINYLAECYFQKYLYYIVYNYPLSINIIL